MFRKLAGAAVLLSAACANAGVIPTLSSVTPEAGAYRFTYDVWLMPSAAFAAGDRITIFDFAGFVAGSAQASGSFGFAASLSGPSYPLLSPGSDDAALFNLTWTYEGAASARVPAGSRTAVKLGSFSALSVFQGETEDLAAGSFTMVGSGLGGMKGSFAQSISVPIAIAAPDEVPEPATLAFLGLGGLALLGARRRTA